MISIIMIIISIIIIRYNTNKQIVVILLIISIMIIIQMIIILIIIIRIIILEEALTTCAQCSAATAKMRGPSGRVHNNSAFLCKTQHRVQACNRPCSRTSAEHKNSTSSASLQPALFTHERRAQIISNMCHFWRQFENMAVRPCSL